jgi:AraC-like DNA-binding protein
MVIEKTTQSCHALLTNVGKPVSEASHESGFENRFIFRRPFRQRFGVAPASVRQKITGLNF